MWEGLCGSDLTTAQKRGPEAFVNYCPGPKGCQIWEAITSVADHFLKVHGGKPRNLQVVDLDQVISNIRGGDLTYALLHLESKLIHRMDTVAPKGLN